MIADAMMELIRGLDAEDLRTIRAQLRAILNQRSHADADSIIGFHSMSSLELEGVLAAADLALLRALSIADPRAARAMLADAPNTLPV